MSNKDYAVTWRCAEKITDNIYVLQAQVAMAGGCFPGCIRNGGSARSYYYQDCSGLTLDLSEYTNKYDLKNNLSTFYKEWKDVEASGGFTNDSNPKWQNDIRNGLYLIPISKTKPLGTSRQGEYYKAITSATYDYSKVGMDKLDSNSNVWSDIYFADGIVSSGRNVYAGFNYDVSLDNSIGMIVPAFNIDASKIKIDGNVITKLY